MKTLRQLGCIGFLICVLLSGCSSSDDETGPNVLNPANLQGTYDLDIGLSRLENLAGSEGQVTVGVVTFDATTWSSRYTTVQTGTFGVSDETTVTVTSDNRGTEDVQAELSDNGQTLMIDVDGDQLVFDRRSGVGGGVELTVANLQGEYELDVTRSTGLDSGDVDVISGELLLAGNALSFTVSLNRILAYRIANRSEIIITDFEGNMGSVDTTLSDEGMRLTLILGDENDADDLYILDKR